MKLVQQDLRELWGVKLLQSLNLRPDEVERTGLMFAFHATTNLGLLWLENTALALFLSKYGTSWLPIIYISSALLGSGLGLFYSWLEKQLPMRRLLVVIALFMALPMFLFWLGLRTEGIILLLTVFLLRLWVDITDTLKSLNTAIAANQLFNIREIKRTYPLISSGVLVAELLSGFSLPLVIGVVGIENVMLLGGIFLLIGAGIMFYLCQHYQNSFPAVARGRMTSGGNTLDQKGWRSLWRFGAKSTQELKGYVLPLLVFFTLVQVILLLVEFLYLQQVESLNLDVKTIAFFLAILSGIISIFELLVQWFVSSRLIDKLGVFISAMLLPGFLLLGCLLTLSGLVSSLSGVIVIKFLDEIFRYTILAGIEPTLFQPLPEGVRNRYQAMVQGIIQPIAMGVTGVALWGISLLSQQLVNGEGFYLLILAVVAASLLWLYSAWKMRSTYVNLLVQSAEQGRLSTSNVDLRAWKQAILQALTVPGSERDHRSCIQLLCQIDPQGVGDVLAPLLSKFSPRLQYQSLEAMLRYPQAGYFPQVANLLSSDPLPEVLALTLRYLWSYPTKLDPNTLTPYLQPSIHATVRATAAALMLRWGTPAQKAMATDILRRMLTHAQEKERVMGCRALREADYLQALRVYIPRLLQDDSLRVRCALLEVIALVRLEEYYPALLKGLHYKSTREAARQALISMKDEAVPLVRSLLADIHQPELVRFIAWDVMGGIGTELAVSALVEELVTSRGVNRRQILKTLIKIPGELGIDRVLDQLGRRVIENFIQQELLLLAQVYGAIADLPGEELTLLRRSLQDAAVDGIDRCFLLMKFLYPPAAIQAAAFNLDSDSRSSIALGIEILDNTLDLPTKQVILRFLDQRGGSAGAKFLGGNRLVALESLLPYQKMPPRDRLRHLLELRHFLSDWCLACCFHGARSARWRISLDVILVCLRHPTGFVREAVLTYLQVASPRTCDSLIHLLEKDPDPLVAAQVRQLLPKHNFSNTPHPPAPSPTRGIGE